MWQDFRYTMRQLRKSPGFATVAVITLALGIAANTTIFSWINATLLNPIPGAARAGELLSIMRGERGDRFPAPPFSYADYADIRTRNQSFSGLLAYHDDAVSLTGDDQPQRVFGVAASANYFDVLGVRPVLGRTFLQTEEQLQGSAPVVVIGYSLWQTRFGGNRSVIGRAMEINRHPFTIIGVAPADFIGTKTGLRQDIWVPLTAENDRILFTADRMQYRGAAFLQVLGRLKHSVKADTSARETAVLMQQIVQQYPESHRGSNSISLDPLWRSPFGTNVYLVKVLPVLLAIAGLVLLLACANVANLLLVRAVARRREFAVRLAVGCNRWHLVRPLLMESLLLALASGAVAALLTVWTATAMESFIPVTVIPFTMRGRVDVSVLLATVLISLLASVISGILPALRSSKLAPGTVLKEESGSGGLHKGRLATGLVVAQLSLSFLLLVCAGLFVRTLQNAEHTDPGFDPENVLLAHYELLPSGYDGPKAIEFHRQLIAKLRNIPGVESASVADWAPVALDKRTMGFSAEGYVPRAQEIVQSSREFVGPEYFHTMRMPLIKGREFTEQDTRDTQAVAVVNTAFAERYWPQQDAIGKRIDVRGRTYVVVGLVQNSKSFRLRNSGDREAVLYLPLLQDYVSDGFIHVRTNGDPMLYLRQVEQAVHELNSGLPVSDATTLKSSTRIATVFERLCGVLVGSFGLIALALASVGLYGVVSYSTRQRTREIGVRVAIGARPQNVLHLVLRQGLRLTVIGLAIGLVLALAFTRLVQSLLIGVDAADTLTYVFIAVVLTVVSLIACYVPAHRASRVDPMVALRYE